MPLSRDGDCSAPPPLSTLFFFTFVFFSTPSSLSFISPLPSLSLIFPIRCLFCLVHLLCLFSPVSQMLCFPCPLPLLPISCPSSLLFLFQFTSPLLPHSCVSPVPLICLSSPLPCILDLWRSFLFSLSSLYPFFPSLISPDHLLCLPSPPMK